MGKGMGKRIIALFAGGIFVMLGSIHPLPANAEAPGTGLGVSEKEWKRTFGYTGTEQIFTAPYSGVYEFEVYGAQGEAAGSNEGGRGGRVTAAVTLSRGEEITIYVGGQDGYNGGGSGTTAAGGGATDVRQGGKGLTDRIIVAGGGGGANNIYPGGNGGETGKALSPSEDGNGEASAEGAGGGGGYSGGASGTEHTGHTHAGNSAAYGGCYTIQRTKNENVEHHWGVIGRGETINFSGPVVQGEADTHYIQTDYPVRDEHGHTGNITWCYFAEGARSSMKDEWWFDSGSKYGNAGGRLASEPVGFTFTTGKTETVVYYDLGCGLDYDKYNVRQAAGGTNYYDEAVCSNAVCESGIRTGDGECSIKLLALYNLYYDGAESVNIYYDGIKVKKVYYKGELIYQGF